MRPIDPATEEQVRRIDEARFKPVRIKPGYEMGFVDDLLDRVIAALRAGRPIRPLLGQRPPVVSFREAYDVESVDSFVSELLEIASQQESSSAVPDAGEDTEIADRATVTDAPAERVDRAEPVNVIQEQQSLWQRLLGPE